MARFNSKTQIHLASQALLNAGIKSEIVGSREYSSIIIGSDDGRYDLMVDWSDETDARKIVSEIQTQSQDLSADLRTSPKTFLKKAIVFALLACVFMPIVFNYVSLKNLSEYLKSDASNFQKKSALIGIVILQIPTGVFIYFLVTSYFA